APGHAPDVRGHARAPPVRDPAHPSPPLPIQRPPLAAIGSGAVRVAGTGVHDCARRQRALRSPDLATMNLLGIAFLLVTAGALLTVPRRWAPIPLLIGCCYMTLGQGVEIGPVSLPMLRILLGVGLLRVIVRGEMIAGGINRMDWLMVVF